MGLINIQAFANIPQPQKKKAPSAASVKTKTIRKKVSEETTIYGEELFIESLDSIRREKEIVVQFSEFNSYGLRFSLDGEFIMSYGKEPSSIILYHCITMTVYLQNLEPHELPEDTVKYEFVDVHDARNKIISIIRGQFAAEKAEKVEAQKEADKLNFQLEQERKEEFEKQFGDEEAKLTLTEPIVEEKPKPIFFRKIVTETVTETTETTEDSIDIVEEKVVEIVPVRKIFFIPKKVEGEQ